MPVVKVLEFNLMLDLDVLITIVNNQTDHGFFYVRLWNIFNLLPLKVDKKDADNI